MKLDRKIDIEIDHGVPSIFKVRGQGDYKRCHRKITSHFLHTSERCFGTEIKLIYWLKHKQSTIKLVAQFAFERLFSVRNVSYYFSVLTCKYRGHTLNRSQPLPS